MHRHGFSLLELSIVVAISGLMLSFILNASQSSSSAVNSECTISTQLQLNYIRAQVEAFARKNDRLPLPAARNVGIDALTYGREASGADIDQIGSGATGVSFGALPFQALGLPASYAGDCWGNKFSYVVTTALTTNATTGGFKDSTVLGNITLKRTTVIDGPTDLAYAIISHGPDELGAVKLNYSAANGTNIPPYDGHGWCTGTDLKHLNCDATSAVVADGTPNDGKDAAANYFDDLVMTGGKPQVIPPTVAYCWGDNTSGQIGDGTTGTDRLTPTGVVSSFGRFTSISAGTNFNCGLALDGKNYCWGHGTSGSLGDDQDTSYNKPTRAVNFFTGVTSWPILEAGDSYNACGIGNNNQAYCWGGLQDTGPGHAGYGSGTSISAPSNFFPVTLPGGVASWKALSVGGLHNCAIGNNDITYCWGLGTTGQNGDGNMVNRNSPVAVTTTAAMTGESFTHFVSLAAGSGTTSCGIDQIGNAYCWGNNASGAAGDAGASGASTSVPVAVTMPGSVKFTSMGMGNDYGCALGDDTRIYCWGDSTDGKTGGVGSSTVPATIAPAAGTGTTTFTSLTVGHNHACAIGTDTVTYCWGLNSDGQLGDSSIASSAVPVAVTMPTSMPGGVTTFDSVSAGVNNTCATFPPPP